MSSTSFSWQTLRAIIGGASALDLPRLDVGTAAEADDFMTVYGFDWSDPAHRAEVLSIRADALQFINEALLPPPAAIHPEVLAQTDVRRLLLWASAPPSDRQLWTCALLRVMHTRAHVDSHLQDTYGAQIRRQILDRFRPHLRGTPEDLMLGDGEHRVPLVDFEMKPVKPWQSVLTKLLHKPENVAADIFDHVGVRFVTPTRLDALRVIYYLRTNSVVMLANVKPTRSRNTLVDIEALEAEMLRLDALVARGEITHMERESGLQRAAEVMMPGAAERSYNPFTADSYRSIQFTSRQMIRIPSRPGAPAARFFFPYEVQILDWHSYQLARTGRASHDVYKARQREAVRQRVLGALIGSQGS